jgi:hypothetical protein
MKISSNINIITASVLTSFLLLGCGSDSESFISTNNFNGQLVDSYVENVNYTCGDGTTGLTDVEGRFSCDSLPIKFSIAGLELGQINKLADDLQVFPQDLVGVAREKTEDVNVLALARFLQSCDEDYQAQNGIKIDEKVKENLAPIQEKFTAEKLQEYAYTALVELVDENITLEHLNKTTEFVTAINDAVSIPVNIKSSLLTPLSTLTQEAKNSLAYMGNEERLAYDVYTKLYELYPADQFANIANNGEKAHIEAVQLLINKYINSYDDFTNINLPELSYKNISLADMEQGIYEIAAIQNLSDMLIEKGEQSLQDALEVGCIIEVTDINDLIENIEIAEDSDAQDLVTTYEYLRDGSYAHYWAFDKGLKSMGIDKGCCSAGLEYCHPEYPQNTTGGNATQDGNGQQKGKQ